MASKLKKNKLTTKNKLNINKKKHRLRNTILIIILVLVFLVSGTGIVTTSIFVGKIHHINDDIEIVIPAEEDFETEPNSEDLPEITPEEVEWPEIAPMSDEKLLNILLVGQDRRPGQGRQRSDTMILCSINVKQKKVALISFLRDLYVQIPGYTDNRLNAAYVFGGFPLLKSALKTNFGISVDGCFEVDFNGFIALIDEIGGIDMYLTAAEAERVGKGTKEGMNHLRGEAALAYARIRKIDSDFQRTNRQRKVLLTAFDKIKNSSLTEILALLNKALPYLTTDMSSLDIISTVTRLFPLATSAQINTYYIPPEDTYSSVYIRGMAVLYPDLKAIRRILLYEYLPMEF